MSATNNSKPEQPAKSVDESRVIMSHMMLPQDTNPAGIVHGGVVMKHIDDAASVVALRHTRCNVVTASIDRLDFHNPVFIGNLLTLKASLNLVGTSSMEIGVCVESEDLQTGEIRHTASAYLSFVALDDNYRPRPVPPLLLVNDEDRRRNRQAQDRRRSRLAEKAQEVACRTAESCQLPVDTQP
ncbi:acyl-CoA thioesterase [Desulfurivibrio dismutans]|uniref:acyl-CoA thioesterase n=1 Tax=Desulfurivibrio dismutans TaxID=1398908 RepID=UPI0023D9CFB8|nr:acyl-CoA thioesterase [Desulfurivibrio alkaliphilus]MDF1615569.1 acyl-CoA thioesterase [Desulfurivibrio alkaliphilus]